MSETKGSSTVIGSALEGVGYVVSAPARLPLVRTVLKEVIKVGLRTSRALQGFAAEQGRQWQQLMSEAQAEAAALESSSAAEPSSAKTPENEEDDLQTLEGVGMDTARLLREAGIRSKRTLVRRNPEKLHEKLVEINDRESIATDVPSAERIQQWIDSL